MFQRQTLLKKEQKDRQSWWINGEYKKWQKYYSVFIDLKIFSQITYSCEGRKEQRLSCRTLRLKMWVRRPGGAPELPQLVVGEEMGREDGGSKCVWHDGNEKHTRFSLGTLSMWPDHAHRQNMDDRNRDTLRLMFLKEYFKINYQWAEWLKLSPEWRLRSIPGGAP